MRLKDIWPTLGDRSKKERCERMYPSHTKKGPGRYHQQGKPKNETK